MKVIPLLLCLTAMSVAAFASPASDARVAIQKAYKSREAAFARKDTRAIMAELAPNYHQTAEGQTYRREDKAAMLEMWFQTMKSLKIRSTITKFTFVNGKARVIVKEDIEQTFIDPETKKLRHMTNVGIVEDTWARINGKWLRERTKTISDGRDSRSA